MPEAYPTYNPGLCPCIAIIEPQGLNPETIIGPFEFGFNMCQLADVRILAAGLVEAEGGPFYKMASTSLIYQQFGTDQAVNKQPGVGYVVIPVNANDTRRDWYLQPGNWAGGSVCAPLVALMYANGVGAPGKWVWGLPPADQHLTIPYPKQYYWQAA